MYGKRSKMGYQFRMEKSGVLFCQSKTELQAQREGGMGCKEGAHAAEEGSEMNDISIAITSISSNELIHKIYAQAYLFIVLPSHLDLAENIFYPFCLPVRIHIHVCARDVKQCRHLITAFRHF
jgi:hypothetical protein